VDDTGLRVALDRLLTDNERARQGIAELQQQIETLIEIMVAAGTLRPGHAELIAKLRQRVEVSRKTPVELSSIEDKYEVTGEPIDCDSRLPLCQARCCSFAVVLSRQDVEGGQLTWELEHPYRLARGPDGYCNHLAATTRAASATSTAPRPAGPTRAGPTSGSGSTSRPGSRRRCRSR